MVVELSRVLDYRVTKGGEISRVACEASDGSKFELIVPFEALFDVIRNLQMMELNLEILQRTSTRPISLPTVEFMEPDPLFMVNALGGIVQPDGQVALRIGEVGGNTFQLLIPKSQSRVLFDLLLEVFAEDDAEKSN